MEEKEENEQAVPNDGFKKPQLPLASPKPSGESFKPPPAPEAKETEKVQVDKSQDEEQPKTNEPRGLLSFLAFLSAFKKSNHSSGFCSNSFWSS